MSIRTAKSHVRFTPNSGHVRCNSGCPLRANSGHEQKRKSGAMSALGQKQTCAVQNGMSASPPIATAKADIPHS